MATRIDGFGKSLKSAPTGMERSLQGNNDEEGFNAQAKTPVDPASRPSALPSDDDYAGDVCGPYAKRFA